MCLLRPSSLDIPFHQGAARGSPALAASIFTVISEIQFHRDKIESRQLNLVGPQLSPRHSAGPPANLYRPGRIEGALDY